jgi:hydrogenase maturation factor HypE
MEKRIINYIAWGIAICSLLVLAKVFLKQNDNPAQTRLEEINDSLFKVIEVNNLKIDSLGFKIDSLNIVSDTLIYNQKVINEYYTQEVYNILSSDSKHNNRRLAETFRASDSLLKSGFYSRVIKLPSTAN